MIRLKIFYNIGEYFNTDTECAEYDSRTFNNILNFYEENPYYDGKEPFRDNESRLFIREIDNADFTSKYGMRTPYGECSLTGLCGGTQYALSAIHYSRMGVYIKFKQYGKDIWGRLAGLPFDILVFICLPFMDYDDIEMSLINIGSFIIENYKDKNGNIYEKSFDNNRDIIYSFNHWNFDLYRDFESVVVDYARMKMKRIELFEYPPIVFNSFQEFGDSIYEKDDWEGNEFRDISKEFMSQEYIERQPSIRFPDVKIHSYLTCKITPVQRYPVIIMINRCEETKSYTLEPITTVKSPSFAELIMTAETYKNDVRLSALDGFGNWNKMILVFDAPKPSFSDDWLEAVFLAEKLEGKTMSLYDGDRIWHELLKFIDGYQLQI